MTDIYDDIERAYKKGENGRMLAAELAATVVGKRNGATQKIADKLSISVDTVERLACAGRMYLLCVKYAEGESASLRNHLYVTHFAAIGKAVEDKELKLGRAEAIDLLIEASKEGWSVETLRGKLPQKERTYTDMAKKYYKHLEKDLIYAPAYDVEDKIYRDIRGAAENLKDACGVLLRHKGLLPEREK